MEARIARDLRSLFPDLPEDRLVAWNIKDPYGDSRAEYMHCAKTVDTAIKSLPLVKAILDI